MNVPTKGATEGRRNDLLHFSFLARWSGGDEPEQRLDSKHHNEASHVTLVAFKKAMYFVFFKKRMAKVQ